MPRPFRTRASAACLATALCCAALGPSILHAALAAAAGSLFEAAPFVLVAEALPKKGGLRYLTVLAGCGCDAAVPGALSLAAIGLCWLTFGPAVAVMRTAAGLVVFFGRGSGACDRGSDTRDRGSEPDAFAQLLPLAPCAALAAVFSSLVADHASALSALPAAGFAAFALGLALGALAPCGTAAVAIAAAVSPHLPFATAGILTTGGLVPRIVLFRSGGHGENARSDGRTGREHGDGDEREYEYEHERDGGPPNGGPWCCRPRPARSGSVRFERIALSLALAMLALSGPRGFINPRLVPFEGLAAAIALAGVRRSPATEGVVVTATLFAALAAGSPEPAYLANETRLDDAFAGERVDFTGVARRRDADTVVQRFAITCCRVDASAIAVRTTAALPVSDGSWIRTTGVLIDAPSGLLLRPDSWRPVPRPKDPFVYR